MTAAKHFNPEMKGGLQLGLDLFENQGQHAAGQERHAAQAVSGPTTVVCLKGRRDDPEIGDVVYVGRPMYRGGWRLAGHLLANPYAVGKDGTAEQVVEKYRKWIGTHQALVDREIPKLRGRRLGCWCEEGTPCHAVVLAERADALEMDL